MPQSPSPRFFESLTRDLVERSASSLLGIYGPRTDPAAHIPLAGPSETRWSSRQFFWQIQPLRRFSTGNR